MQLDVVFRCETQGTTRDPISWSDTAALRCLSALVMSLVKALNVDAIKEVHLSTYTHGLDEDKIQNIQRVHRKCPFVTEIRREDPSASGLFDPYFISQKRMHKFQMILFVESYCLLAPEAIEQMILDYQMMTAMNGEDLIICPIDDLELYNEPEPSLIVAGRRRYWRTVRRTSRSVMMSQRAFQRSWQHFLGFDRPEKDAPTSYLKNIQESNLNHNFISTHQLAALTPMPSLALSLNTAIPPPFVDWEDWVRDSYMTPPELSHLRVPHGIVHQ